MKQFSSLGIKPTTQNLVGDKVNIDRILNREIIVHKYTVEPSKYQDKGCGKCLYLQIEFKEELGVLFVGSKYLIDMIERVDKGDFPFKTTIVKKDGHYEFT